MRHKHADVLEAIANGKAVQWADDVRFPIWYDACAVNPITDHELLWRIKPKEPEYEWQWIIYNKELNKYSMTIHCLNESEANCCLSKGWELQEKYELSKKPREVK